MCRKNKLLHKITHFFFVKFGFREFCLCGTPPACLGSAAVRAFPRGDGLPSELGFGDSTGAHPRTRIGFRREFLPRTSAVHSTYHNHFLDTWSFSFSRNMTLSANRVPPSPSETPCKQEPFAPRSLPASTLLRSHPTPAPLLAQGQVSQVPVQNFRNAPCPYAPSRRARRKTTPPRPCRLPLS